MEEIGCQPRWITHQEMQLPVCKNKTDNSQYALKVFRTMNKDKIKLQEETGCLRPCNYMEYRV